MRIDSNAGVQNSEVNNSGAPNSGAPSLGTPSLGIPSLGIPSLGTPGSGGQNAAATALPTNASSSDGASVQSATAGSSPVGADEAQLSAFPQQVQVLVALAVQLSDPGPDKVSALRQAVAGGAYQPDVQKVAGALFASLALNRAA